LTRRGAYACSVTIIVGVKNETLVPKRHCNGDIVAVIVVVPISPLMENA